MNIKNIDTYKIILIERDVDDYYIHKRRENRDAKRDIFYTSGKQRRDILNYRDMSNELKKIFGSKIHNVILEKTSIFYQYQIFKHASIVIGQHGAGLGNIIFMKPNTHLIEIMSPWGVAGNHFRNLADYLRINYGHVFMQNDIDNVDINEIMRISEMADQTPRRTFT